MPSKFKNQSKTVRSTGWITAHGKRFNVDVFTDDKGKIVGRYSMFVVETYKEVIIFRAKWTGAYGRPGGTTKKPLTYYLIGADNKKYPTLTAARQAITASQRAAVPKHKKYKIGRK